MNHSDEVITFACGDAKLIGILSTPRTRQAESAPRGGQGNSGAARRFLESVPEMPCDTAVVVVVGGPQYRAGSHRQFVLLARALADAGYPVLRFDVRGMGDSGGEPRDFEAVGMDVGAAIDALALRLPQVGRFVLWGLCDGASAALLYCHATPDPRVRGLCLLNPWVRSEAGLAATQVKHYYTRRLVQPEFWAKLASGKVGWNAQAEFRRKLRLAFAGQGGSACDAVAAPQPAYQQRMATAWNEFDGAILLMLSGQDLTAKEFVEQSTRDAAWAGALRHPRLTRLDLAEADHTFSDPASRQEVHASTLDWIGHEVVCRPPRRAGAAG